MLVNATLHPKEGAKQRIPTAVLPRRVWLHTVDVLQYLQNAASVIIRVACVILKGRKSVLKTFIMHFYISNYQVIMIHLPVRI